MTDPNRSDAGVAQCMDAYTVDSLGSEEVIVALPNMLGDSDSKYPGSALLGKQYILDLCANAMERGVLESADLESLIKT